MPDSGWQFELDIVITRQRNVRIVGQSRAPGLLEGDRTASGPALQWQGLGYFPPALTRLCIAKQNSRDLAILRFAAALRFRFGFWSAPPAVW
jgi:hypothetical protein